MMKKNYFSLSVGSSIFSTGKSKRRSRSFESWNERNELLFHFMPSFTSHSHGISFLHLYDVDDYIADLFFLWRIENIETFIQVAF